MARRVVSLVPSSTETLLALGADVVACTRFCEQPDLRHIGGTKNPDVEAICALQPDVVVLDREENRLEDHDALVAAGLDVIATEVTDVASAIEVVTTLADAAGVAPPPPGVVDRTPRSTRRTAFVPIWRRPWMTISSSTYGGSVLASIGVELVSNGSNDAYPSVELDEVSALAPDLVLVPSEPYDFRPAHLDELRRACAASDVVEIDGQDLFWWGIRTVPAIARLARALADDRPG